MALPEATWVRPPARDRLHRSRRALQVATSLVFIAAPFVDLLRFDLKNGALILAGTPYGLGELSATYLVVLLFILVVFAGALLYGRIYCGWMCPQTTLSELVAGLERRACRGARGTVRCRVAGPAAALLMGSFVAASLVSYFLDPADLLAPPPAAWGSFGVTALLLTADLQALRHRLCVGICPYGILQNIVQDGRTLGVSLDPARRAECTSCLLCVRACFMGVDIRERAFDPRCLNCGDCISAARLAKRCPADPLIRFRYGTESSRWPAWLRRFGISDARRALVAVLVAAVAALSFAALGGEKRVEVKVAALHDRTSTDGAGAVRNVYRVTVSNRTRRPVRLHLEAAGVPGLALEAPEEIALRPNQHLSRDVSLAAPGAGLRPGAHPVTVRSVPEGPGDAIDIQARFFVPSRR
jgi:polyferredoxin